MVRDATLVGLLGLTWGLNWTAARFALDEMSPLLFRSVGLTGGTLVMFGFLLLRGESCAVPRAQWGRVMLVGTFSLLGYNLLSAFAQMTTLTGRTAVLSYTMPLWAVLFARIGLGEPLDRRRLAGLGLGAAGLLTLGLPLLREGALTLGIGLAVGSGIVWAIGSVLLKRFPIDASPLVITAWQLAYSAALTVPAFWWLDPAPAHWPERLTTWGGVAYQIVVGQAIGTSLWFTMLRLMPTGIASIGSLLVPAVGMIGATLILGERPTVADWIGLVLIVASSAVVVIRPATKR